jgi:hypothetical protein
VPILACKGKIYYFYKLFLWGEFFGGKDEDGRICDGGTSR